MKYVGAYIELLKMELSLELAHFPRYFKSEWSIERFLIEYSCSSR